MDDWLQLRPLIVFGAVALGAVVLLIVLLAARGKRGRDDKERRTRS
jgi:hypothetical protein